ncbi:MAG TPA: ABC transporter substrate-binding protein [candidate division Zixibacteria bacterium]|nr:ABC transporter substrate-binding protein [candidate division Zixibacteria bacterium]
MKREGWLDVVPLLAAAALFCGGPRAGAADRILIGNVSRTVEQLPNYAATDKGFFAREGIQGDVVLIGSTDTLVQALVAGQIHVAIVDPSAAINAIERGAALKIIGGTVPIAAYTLVGCPKYKTIRQLKGTTISVVSLVSGSTIFLREMLRAEGLELNRDYTILQGGPTTQRLASLKGCNAAATMVLGGDLPRARELGFPEIARLQDYIANLQFHSFIVDSRWAEANSDLTVRYLKAMIRAMQWAHANKEEAAALVTQRTGIPLKYTRATVEEYLTQGIISRDGSINREGFQRLIDLMGERLFRQKPYPPPEKYLDMSYLRRAHRELGFPASR